MSALCYFIGGPLDLTKALIQRPERRLYALERVAFTLSEIHTVQDASTAIDMLQHRHVYDLGSPVRVAGTVEKPLVYIYAGREPSRKP